MVQSPVLYASKQNQFSENIVQRLQRSSALHKFVLVDVDSVPYEQIPPYVTHAPCVVVFLDGRARVLVNEDLSQFVDLYLKKLAASAQTQHNAQGGAGAEVQPCIGGRCDFAFLEGYDSLDRPEEATSTGFGMFDSSFAPAAQETETFQRMQQHQQREQQNGQSKKLADGKDTLDNLISARNSEILR